MAEQKAGEIILVIEWSGLSAFRREVRGPFPDEETAWKWYRQQCGYPRGTTARCERRIVAGVLPDDAPPPVVPRTSHGPRYPEDQCSTKGPP